MATLIPYLIPSVLYCVLNTQLNLTSSLNINSVISNTFNFQRIGSVLIYLLTLTFDIFLSNYCYLLRNYKNSFWDLHI